MKAENAVRMSDNLVGIEVHTIRRRRECRKTFV